jgi:co-chaperonin GroES (HSP10)
MIAVGPTFLTETPPAPRFQPRGSMLHVRFLPVAETWASGIYLPDTMRQNSTEAEVIGVGPGRWALDSDPPFRFQPWPRVGDIVAFEEHMARRIGDEAFIDAEAVLGVVMGTGTLRPLSDWLMLKPEPRPEETAEGVHYPTLMQRWRQKGTVLDYGPGYLYVSGPCGRLRRTVPEILNLTDLPVGSIVYWRKQAHILQIGREVVDAWLVRAGDLVCIEEPDAEGKAKRTKRALKRKPIRKR